MITHNIRYEFKNGVICEFYICTNVNNPIAKVEWDGLTEKNKYGLWDEYANKCIPFVYQQIADLTCQTILWVDKRTFESKYFEPSINKQS